MLKAMSLKSFQIVYSATSPIYSKIVEATTIKAENNFINVKCYKFCKTFSMYFDIFTELKPFYIS